MAIVGERRGVYLAAVERRVEVNFRRLRIGNDSTELVIARTDHLLVRWST